MVLCSTHASNLLHSHIIPCISLAPLHCHLPNYMLIFVASRSFSHGATMAMLSRVVECHSDATLGQEKSSQRPCHVCASMAKFHSQEGSVSSGIRSRDLENRGRV